MNLPCKRHETVWKNNKNQKEESAMKGPWNLHESDILPKTEAEIKQKNQIDNQHRLFG